MQNKYTGKASKNPTINIILLYKIYLSFNSHTRADISKRLPPSLWFTSSPKFDLGYFAFAFLMQLSCSVMAGKFSSKMTRNNQLKVNRHGRLILSSTGSRSRLNNEPHSNIFSSLRPRFLSGSTSKPITCVGICFTTKNF